MKFHSWVTRWAVALCVGCIGAAAAQVEPPGPAALELHDGVGDIADPMAFFPVEPGRKWSYQIRREAAAIAPDYTYAILVEGRWKEWFEEGSDAVDTDRPAFVRKMELREVYQGNGTVREGTLTFHLTVEPGAVLIHALRFEGLKGYSEDLQVVQPTPMFESPAAAQSRTDPTRLGLYGLTLIEDTVSIGLENVDTLAWTFEDCLKFTVSGHTRGRLTDIPEDHDIDYRYEEVLWFARHVGLVKLERVVRGKLTREDLGELEINEEVFKELRAYTKPRP